MHDGCISDSMQIGDGVKKRYRYSFFIPIAYRMGDKMAKSVNVNPEIENMQELLVRTSSEQKRWVERLLKSNGIACRWSDSRLDIDVAVPAPLLRILKQKCDRSERTKSVQVHDKNKRAVTVDPTTTTTSKEEEDLEDIEKRIKHCLSLRPSQLRIRKKIKDLTKSILRHRHVCAEKDYGQDLTDRDDDVNEYCTSLEDNVEEMDAVTNDETKSDFADEDDDTEVLSAAIFETADGDNKLVDLEGEDTEDQHTDDASFKDETDDAVTEVDTIDDDAIDHLVDEIHVDDVHRLSRLRFDDASLQNRFVHYKKLLETHHAIDFGESNDDGIVFV